MTRPIEMVLKDPGCFIRIKNPNPNDDAPCYVCVFPIKDKPLKLFTRPIRDWELSDEDIQTIDDLVKNWVNQKKIGIYANLFIKKWLFWSHIRTQSLIPISRST